MTEGRDHRLRYAPDHWVLDIDPVRGLELYLEACRRPFNATKIEIIRRLLPADLRGARVLDFGTGGGFFAVLCAQRGAEVVAVDAEDAVLQAAAHHARREGVAGRCTFVRSLTFPAPYRTARFDLILAKDVIEHVPDDARLLGELAAVQMPGGQLIVSTQNALSLTYLIEGFYYRVWRGDRSWCGWDSTHLRFYTPRSLGRMLRTAGYLATARHGIYIVPYRILTYLLLFRRWIELPALRHVDLRLGGRWPWNLFGWDIVVAARRA